MKHSTVSPDSPPEAFDTARKVRGVMGEERVTAAVATLPIPLHPVGDAA